MKATNQNVSCKNRKTNVALLMIGLTVSALTIVVEAAKPPPQVPSEAVSEYPGGFFHTAAELTHVVPGTVGGGGSVIFWDWYWEATIQLDNYAMGVAGVSISLIRNGAGQVEYVRVKAQAGPPGGRWPWHDTDLIPVANRPVLDLVNGCTLEIGLDNIPVWAHATYKERSPRVGIAGHMALGNLVISPKF